jgi:uncharacterized iron-regulated membrane protein
MAVPSSAQKPRYYGLLWRWHFFAALIVIPFVLWQSTTGTLYLWSEWWMDKAHPELRFVPPDARTATPGAQIAAALASAWVIKHRRRILHRMARRGCQMAW